MELNACLIRDYLELPVTHSRIAGDPLPRCLKGITFWRPGSALRRDMVTLVKAAELAALPPRQGCVICCGGTLPETLPEGLDVIAVEEANLLTVYEDVQRIFRLFDDLEQALYTLLKEDAPLNQFGNAALPFFQNPISMYSEDLRLIFFSELPKPAAFRLYADDEVDTYLPDEEIEELKVDETYGATIGETVPAIFPADRWGYRILYYNIRIDGIYVARLMVLETDRPLRDSDHTLLLYLADFITYMMNQKNLPMNNHPRYLDACLGALLAGETPRPQELHPALEALHWLPTDEYLCIAVIASQQERDSWVTSAVAIRIEKSLPGSVCLIRDGRIVALSNLTRSAASQEEQLQQLVYLIREGLMKAGISRVFDNLYRLRDYYQQSVTALTIGEQRDPTFWFYRYERYALLDLLQGAQGGRSPESWYPAGLKKLMDYDRAHNRQLVKALRVYLRENMHIANTTRALYLQRATFLYQLRRITEISELRLEDPEVRLELLIVFSILDKLGKGQEEIG